MSTQDWAPANDLELNLYEALCANDTSRFLLHLAGAQLLLPMSTEADEAHADAAWLAATVNDLPCLPVFTSSAALQRGTNSQVRHHRAAQFRDLVAAWPDMRYLMALDPMTPLQSTIAASDLIRVGTRPIVDILRHPGDNTTPAAGTVMQKFLAPTQASRMLRNRETTVSGYVVPMDETTHLRTLRALLDELALPTINPDIAPQSTEVYVLRWLAVGAQLYQPAYGGVDEERMRAAQGWVIEEPPFHGTGFVDGAKPPVQLYRVHALPLTHGATIHVLTDDGQQVLLATYDADRDLWVWSAAFLESVRDQAVGDETPS